MHGWRPCFKWKAATAHLKKREFCSPSQAARKVLAALRARGARRLPGAGEGRARVPPLAGRGRSRLRPAAGSVWTLYEVHPMAVATFSMPMVLAALGGISDFSFQFCI